MKLLPAGNLDDRVNERILYEVMVQAGPVVDMYIPRDRESQKHKGYGFAEYDTEESAQYAVNLFSNLLNLFDRPVRISVRLTCTFSRDRLLVFPSSTERQETRVDSFRGWYPMMLSFG